jgi:hypothetical protein
MSKPFYEVGRYEVECASQGFTKTSTGKTQFVLRFLVKGKVNPADPESLLSVPAQYERTYYRVLTENTMEYFINDLESLNVHIGSFSELDPENPDHVPLKGKLFDAFCNHKNDLNGDLREEWAIARMSTSKPVESIASSEVKSLDRLFGKHLKKAPVASSAQRSAPQPAAVAAFEINDDDVPF